jgi:ribosomal protein S18 acetylase RimI-like enzyme
MTENLDKNLELNEYIVRHMEKDDMEMMLLDILQFDGMIFKDHAYDMPMWCELIGIYQHAVSIYHNEILVGLIVSVHNKNVFGSEYHDQIGNSLSYIVTFAVHENHRKKGLGKLLLTSLEQKLSATSECYNIILDVDNDNIDAISLYTKNGYKIVKDLDECQYIMTKSLYPSE